MATKVQGAIPLTVPEPSGLPSSVCAVNQQLLIADRFQIEETCRGR